MLFLTFFYKTRERQPLPLNFNCSVDKLFMTIHFHNLFLFLSVCVMIAAAAPLNDTYQLILPYSGTLRSWNVHCFTNNIGMYIIKIYSDIIL